jgi:catalase
MLVNVDLDLASTVAAELGMEVPKAMSRAGKGFPASEINESPALSIFFRPGDGSIARSQIAIFVADGSDGEAAIQLHHALIAKGTAPNWIGPRLGSIKTLQGDSIEIEGTLETNPSVLFDALAIPGRKSATITLGNTSATR